MLRFINARILTMKEGEEIFEGEVCTEGSKITYVGPSRPTEKAYQTIDCKGNLLLPGFKDAHTHSGMSIFRSLADDVALDTWLHKCIFPREAKLKPEDIYQASKLSILEYVSSGITSVFEMYIDPYAIHRAFTEMGFRCVQTSGLNDFTQFIEKVEECFNNLNGSDPLHRFTLGCHAEYTCNRSLLEKLSELSHKYKAPVFLHINETEREVQECIKKYGKSPAAFLDSLGLFDYGGGGYHCVHMTEEDMEVFTRRNLGVVTNPASNLKLASGIAPIKRFLDEGLSISIGTDGASSNNALDMFREMYLVTALSKVREKDPSVVDAMEVLKMATVNASHLMNINCDTLSAGKEADIIMIDLGCPNMQPLNNIPKNIVYSGSKQNIKMTVIAGEIVYMDGEFPKWDKDEIYARCNEIIRAL